MAKSKEGGAPFAKDFGYLDRFLAGVTEYAATADGGRGERLRRLLDGEIERWREIGALLRGEASIPPPAPAAPAEAGSAPTAAENDAARAAAPSSGPFGLTVGSLRRRSEASES